MFPKKFRNIFAETMFPSLPTCFQMFPARQTLFSRLGKFKNVLRLNVNNTLKIGYSRICACAGYVYIFCFDQL